MSKNIRKKRAKRWSRTIAKLQRERQARKPAAEHDANPAQIFRPRPAVAKAVIGALAAEFIVAAWHQDALQPHLDIEVPVLSATTVNIAASGTNVSVGLVGGSAYPFVQYMPVKK